MGEWVRGKGVVLVLALAAAVGGTLLLISGGLRLHAHYSGHATVTATVTQSATSCFSRGCHRTAHVRYSYAGKDYGDVSVVDADWSEGQSVKVLVNTAHPERAIKASDRGILRLVIGIVLWGLGIAMLLPSKPTGATP